MPPSARPMGKLCSNPLPLFAVPVANRWRPQVNRLPSGLANWTMPHFPGHNNAIGPSLGRQARIQSCYGTIVLSTTFSASHRPRARYVRAGGTGDVQSTPGREAARMRRTAFDGRRSAGRAPRRRYRGLRRHSSATMSRISEDKEGARQMRMRRHSRPICGQREQSVMPVRVGPAQAWPAVRKSRGEAG